MACIVKANQHGYLAYRLFWEGRRSWEGTNLKDTPKNREKLAARAAVMSQEMEARTFDYLHWFPKGNKAPLFRPTPAVVPLPIPTVRAYAKDTWLPRKVAPLVRATLADTYRSALNRHILPFFGDLPLSNVTPAALEDFRALLTRPKRDGGKGLRMKTARDLIDGSFRALYRDARTIDRLVAGRPRSIPSPILSRSRSATSWSATSSARTATITRWSSRCSGRAYGPAKLSAYVGETSTCAAGS